MLTAPAWMGCSRTTPVRSLVRRSPPAMARAWIATRTSISCSTCFPGPVAQAGIVSSTDLTIVRDQTLEGPTIPTGNFLPFSPYADVDGSSLIISTQVTLVRNALLNTLPGGTSPSPSAALAVLPAMQTVVTQSGDEAPSANTTAEAATLSAADPASTEPTTATSASATQPVVTVGPLPLALTEIAVQPDVVALSDAQAVATQLAQGMVTKNAAPQTVTTVPTSSSFAPSSLPDVAATLPNVTLKSNEAAAVDSAIQDFDLADALVSGH